MLTSIFVPSMILKLLPFIIFISSMIFMLQIRNNKDLLSLKVYGFSNLKIFFVLAFTSFFLGWIILFIVTPISSSMVKYYEKTKSLYAKDIDHLITVNKNGLWIKESLKNKERIITASNPENFNLSNIIIYHLDRDFKLKEKILSKTADIRTKNWVMKDVVIFQEKNGVFENEKKDTYQINSIYDYEKIKNLFRNFDSISFLQLVVSYNNLLESGYNERYLTQNLHSMLTLPFF